MRAAGGGCNGAGREHAASAKETPALRELRGGVMLRRVKRRLLLLLLLQLLELLEDLLLRVHGVHLSSLVLVDEDPLRLLLLLRA